jgi:hypothetical protein
MRAIRRRWYVVLVGLVATGMLGYAAYAVSPPEYKARGLVVLLPSASTVGLGGNPFLGLGNLELPAQVLVAYYSSASAQEDAAKVAPQAKIAVSMEDSTRGPVIAIDVQAPTAKAALDSLDYVSDSIPGTLDRLQREVGAPRSTDVRSLPLTLDGSAVPDRKSATRLAILAGLLGLSGTAFLAFAIDGLLMRRSELRRASAPGGALDRLRARTGRRRGEVEGDDVDLELELAEIAELRGVAPCRTPGSENAARKRG